MTGEQLKMDGLAEVEANGQEFIDNARSVALTLLRNKESITTDDVRDVLDEKGIYPHHSNAYGAIFKTPDFRCVGRAKSRRTSNHGRWISVWGAA